VLEANYKMSNFDYVDNNIEKRRYWIYSQLLHKQKLEEIKQRSKCDTPFRSTSTSRNNKSTKIRGFFERGKL
jgi:hypothetical protein